MRNCGSIVCKSCPCLPRGPTNSVRMCTIVTAALQQQYLQTELILWICLTVLSEILNPLTCGNPPWSSSFCSFTWKLIMLNLTLNTHWTCKPYGPISVSFFLTADFKGLSSIQSVVINLSVMSLLPWFLFFYISKWLILHYLLSWELYFHRLTKHF
jgi:hypothetical protein